MTQTPEAVQSPEWLAGAWADVLTSELAWKAQRFNTTQRARLYLAAGLPLDRVLDALKISRATWYRRVAEHDAEKAANVALYEGSAPRCVCAYAKDGTREHRDACRVHVGEDQAVDQAAAAGSCPACTQPWDEHISGTVTAPTCPPTAHDHHSAPLCPVPGCVG